MGQFDKVTQSGISVNRIGAANMQGLTLFQGVGPQYHESPGQEEAESEGVSDQGSPHLWLAALLVLAATLWIVNQHYEFGPLNLAFIILVVMAGSVLLKTIFGKFYVPGLSPVILAA